MSELIRVNGIYAVNITGIDEAVKALERARPEMRKAIGRAIADASHPVLTRARANAAAIADARHRYGGSLSIRSYPAKLRAVLYSSDEAAGVKEYANVGSRHTYARKTRSGVQVLRDVRVGAPHRGSPARVMIPAVEDSADEVMNRIDAALARILDGAFDGQG